MIGSQETIALFVAVKSCVLHFSSAAFDERPRGFMTNQSISSTILALICRTPSSSI